MLHRAESGLIRAIRKCDLIAVTLNAVIGAGIFGLPSKVFAIAGVYSPAVIRALRNLHGDDRFVFCGSGQPLH